MVIEYFIKNNIDRIKNVLKVEGGKDTDNKTNFNAIKITIEHYKKQ